MSNKETGAYRLTPFGLLSMELGDEAARRAIDRIEMHLRRHYGVPSAIALTPEGMIFTRLEQGGSNATNQG